MLAPGHVHGWLQGRGEVVQHTLFTIGARRFYSVWHNAREAARGKQPRQQVEEHGSAVWDPGTSRHPWPGRAHDGGATAAAR